MGYITLMILSLLLSILFYKIFKKEIICPTVITCLNFSLAALAAFIGTSENSWNFLSDINSNTVWFIVLGIFSFGIGEFLARISRFKKTNIERINDDKIIRIDYMKNLIMICFIVLTIVLLYLNLKSIVGGGSLSSIINEYKSSSVLYNENALEEGTTINSLIMNMLRFCEMAGVVYSYIVIKNLLNKDKISKNIFYIIPIVMSIFLSMMVGGRATLLKSLMAAFMIWGILYTKDHKLPVRKFFKIALKVAIVFVPLCYFILPLLGGKTSSNMVDYATFYLGSEIPAFDHFLDNSIFYSTSFGEQTFGGIRMFLSKFGIVTYSAYQSEWLIFTPTLYTNLFTQFKPFFQDFGLMGLIFCPMIFGYVFSKMYIHSKEKVNCRYLIFFAYFTSYLIDQARSNVFFNSFLSTRTIIYWFCMIVITWFLFGKKKIRNGEV